VIKLINYRNLLAIAAILVIAACSRTAVQSPQIAGLPVPGTIDQATPFSNPAQLSNQTIEISNFIAPAAFSKMNDTDKAQASSAQFFALQFGRPGAPRTWKSPSGITGKITVGPFVRVNELNCREFTNIVTVDEVDSTKSGTSCREANGNWFVESFS